MAFVSPSYSVADIIRRAAAMNKEPTLNLKLHPERLQQYYDALNDVLMSFARRREWWWMNKENVFVTKADQATYTLRTQTSATVTFATGTGSDGNYITISGRTYEFDTNDSITAGRVQVDISGGADADECATAFVAAVNADTSAECYAVATTDTVVELYWIGNDGYGEAITASGTYITVDSTFTYTMPDFLALKSIRHHETSTLQRVSPDVVHANTLVASDGVPAAYAIDEAEATIRIYSHGMGRADDTYRMDVRYQAMPSLVAMDGTGDFDFPVQFRDILPRMIVLTLKEDSYDEDAVFGDSRVAKRLDDMENFMADMSQNNEYNEPSTALFTVLDKRVST